MREILGILITLCVTTLNCYGQTGQSVPPRKEKKPFSAMQGIEDLWHSLDLPQNKGKLITTDSNGKYILTVPVVWDGSSDLKENVVYVIKPDKMARFMVMEDGFAEWLLIYRQRSSKGPNITDADFGPKRKPTSLPPNAVWVAHAVARGDSLAGGAARASLQVIPCPVKLTAWLYVDSLNGYYLKRTILPGTDKADILLSIKGGTHFEEAGVKIYAPEVNIYNRSHYHEHDWQYLGPGAKCGFGDLKK